MIVASGCGAGSARGRAEVGAPVRGVVALVNAGAPPGDLYVNQFCGGVLIEPRMVLTAAHCVAGRLARDLEVVVGADNVCRGGGIDGVRVAVSAISSHPGYDEASGRFDLALLTLASEAPGEVVRAIAASDGADAVGVGWGRPAPGGAASCRVMRTTLRVLGPAQCATAINPGGHQFDPTSMLCALPSAGRADTCDGDSGGPLFSGTDPQHGDLIGIVSWGSGCGAGVPGVYARASAWRLGSGW